MSELSQQTCEACRADAPRLSPDEIEFQLSKIPDWKVIQADGVNQLVRVFAFKNFVEAQSAAVILGELAESQNHHPALLVEWGRLTVYWWTHKIAGLHKNDVIMAAKTDRLIGK